MGMTIQDRRRVIEKIKEMSADTPITPDDVTKALISRGYKYATIDNIFSELYHYKILERVVIKPSDGFSDTKFGYKWRAEQDV